MRKQLLHYARSFFESLDEAEDIVQEVMMKLWLMRSKLSDYDSIEALSTLIAKNLCLNRLKVLRRQMVDLEHLEAVNEPFSPDIGLEQKDEVSHVMRIIDQLPEIQQAVLRMRCIDEFEIDEIAEITGSKPEAVRMNLSRARKRVKDLFFKHIERRI